MERIELSLAEDISDRVFYLADLWISRSNKIPFYTLGRCVYLDGKTPEYFTDSVTYNKILLDMFGDLYAGVTEGLQSYFNEPVTLASDLAIPGFHIFLSSPELTKQTANWHVDHPHKTIGLSGSDHYTFTLALKLPSSGGGLDVIGQDGEQQYIPYSVNTMTVSDGQTPHRIACLKEFVPGESRITLQGHLYRRDKILEAFF